MPSFDANRPWRHLYGRRWQRERLRHLAKHPLCKRCEELGQLTPATIVDHIRPHKGDARLFWDPLNRQSLCKHHHDGWKQMLEKAPAQCGSDGYPDDGSW